LNNYFKHFLSLILTTAIIILIYCNYETIPEENITSIFSGLANNAITLASILVATLAILLSISGSRLVKKMSKTGHFKNLLKSILSCIILFIIVYICCTVALYFPGGEVQLLLPIASGLLAYSLFWFINTCYKFYQVLTHLHD